MASSMSGLRFSSTCGGCGYSSCICYKGTAPKAKPDEYAPFGIYHGPKPKFHALGYPGLSRRLRDEVDGLQAGVSYLNKFEPEIEGNHPNKFTSSPSAISYNMWRRLHPPSPLSKYRNWDDWFWAESNDLTGAGQAPPSNGSSGHPSTLFSPPTPPPEAPTSSSYLFGSPTIPEHQNEEQSSADPKTDDSTKKTKNLPQATQWASLRELCLSSRLQYMKFLILTAKYDSRGIKKLRKMYGSAIGMLDTGIMTFRDVLDGQEPSSLKEVFAFTCLSYVMSKILQKNGRMESSNVLTDTGQWRWAIKKEKDRLIYDEVVKIIWPEIELLATHSKATDASLTSSLPELRRGCMTATDLSLDSNSTGCLYLPSSMMAYGMDLPSECNFIESACAISCSYIASDTQSNHDGQENDLGLVNEDSHHRLQDLAIELLQETSSHDAFMFADFLNLDSLPLDSNINSAYAKQPPDVMSAAQPPDSSSQVYQSIGPIETINPKRLCISYARLGNNHMESLINPVTNSKPLVQEESLSSDLAHSALPYSLEYLVDTDMFQIVVEFIKFVSSLGDLLYRLSGCGLTTRRKKHEIEDYSRQVHDFGDFLNGASKLVFEPIREALGEINESFNAVLCMAETFVRLGRLQTVREIEEYIITTSRHLVCGYDSFVTLLSKTLRQCLSASDQMAWDHVYPSFSVDQEDYSILYLEKREAEEVAWALRNLRTENNVEPTTPNSALAAELSAAQHEGRLSFISDPGPTKKQKSSPAYQSTTSPSSSSSGEPSVAYCQYRKCKKSYKGKDARVNLRRHVRTVHEGCKPIRCPKCGLESSRRDNLRKHFLLKHQGEKIPEILTSKTRA